MAKSYILKPIIRKWEGKKYTNRSSDRGGPTKWGVTIVTFREVFGKNKTIDDLKNMTEEQWNYIFINKFWNKWRADSIESQSIADLVVDWLWASGIYGIKYPQRVLGIKDDGIVGQQTINAINKYPNQKELFQKLWNRRKKHFEAIARNYPGQQANLDGWLNRLNDFKWIG